VEGLAMEEVSIFMDTLSILQPNGKFQHFVVVWYIFAVLVCCTAKNLATLVPTVSLRTKPGPDVNMLKIFLPKQCCTCAPTFSFLSVLTNFA
jgi:hypothetical protein